MKRILILGAGEMQIPVIQKAKECNVYSVVADYDEKAPGLAYASQAVLVSANDYEQVLKTAQEYMVDGILTTSDYPVNIVAQVSEKLSLYSMSVDVAAICTDKYVQRSLFLKQGISTPYFELFGQEECLQGFRFFPCIMKPIDSSASRGVKKINSPEELKIQYKESVHFSRKGEIIVEEFIEGREFSVETFTQDHVTTIIAITEKLTLGEEKGYFVEDTHIIPARISDEERGVIKEEVERALRLIGVNNCPTHTEVKLNARGAFIIEIACRLGGDYITSDLVPLATGVDMLANLIKVTLGERINVAYRWKKCACVQFLNQSNYNRCVDFIHSGDSHITRYEIKEYQDREIKNSIDRLGYVIVQAEEMNEIETILKKIK